MKNVYFNFKALLIMIDDNIVEKNFKSNVDRIDDTIFIK